MARSAGNFRAVADSVETARPLCHRRHLGPGADRAAPLADTTGDLDWVVAIDSTIVRAHQHAAGAHTAGPEGDV